jgi:hypothetical protein
MNRRSGYSPEVWETRSLVGVNHRTLTFITLGCYEVCCHKDRLYSRNPAEVDSEDSLKQNGYNTVQCSVSVNCPKLA